MKVKKRKIRLFPELERPAFADTLRFPADVTKLAAVNVSELHGKYTSMFAYANQELCRLNVDILDLQTQISLRKNVLFRRFPAMNSQERWRRDAVLESDAQIERLEKEIALKKQEREYANMFLTNFDRYLTALSRELSRKTHEQALR